MNIGALKIKLQLFDNHSLKAKRKIVQSLITKLRNEFPISVAEVDLQDSKSYAVIGIALISSDKTLIRSLLDKVMAFVLDNQGNYQVIDDEKYIHSEL
ncbi:MAG: DUF503 domain-containing protein [Pseudomonadota bacterium]